jgi:hypothetical protein
MKNWLKWIPNPNSWMSAILLNLLMGAFVFGIKCIQDPLGKFLRQNFSYRLLLTYQVLAILLPILAIAFTHHFLHLLLDRFFPETQTPDTARTEGLFPGILSWWEGLYGWLVIVLSVTLSIAIIAAFFHSDESFLTYMQMLFSWDRPEHLLSAPSIGRTVIAAYFYQFEYLVHRQIIAASSGSYYRR